MAQLAERLGFDLAGALARDLEAPADLLQGVLTFLADAEPQSEDLLFLRGEHGQGPLDLGRQVLVQQRVVRGASRLVLEEVAELGILTDRRLERQRLARGLKDEPHLLFGGAAAPGA